MEAGCSVCAEEGSPKVSRRGDLEAELRRMGWWVSGERVLGANSSKGPGSVLI